MSKLATGSPLGASVESGEIANNAVTDAKLRDSAAVSVIGRAANSAGDPADIAAGSNGQFLARAADALSFVTPSSANLSDVATLATLNGAEVFTNKTLTAPAMTNVNITDVALSLNGAKFQMFALNIANNAGTLQHRIIAEHNSLGASAYVDKVTGASPTYANTPSVAAGVGFTSGGGVDSTGTNRFIFDVPAQTDAKFFTMVVLEFKTSSLTVDAVAPRLISTNINGVTRNRLALTFQVAGAAFALDTTNITAGAHIRVRVLALIE